MTVFEVLDETGKTDPAWIARARGSKRASRSTARRDFAGAKRSSRANTGDGPSEMYVERCNMFIDEPPPDDWDGVWRHEGEIDEAGAIAATCSARGSRWLRRRSARPSRSACSRRKVMKAPKFIGAAAGAVSRGDQLTVKEVKGDWYRVEGGDVGLDPQDQRHRGQGRAVVDSRAARAATSIATRSSSRAAASRRRSSRSTSRRIRTSTSATSTRSRRPRSTRPSSRRSSRKAGCQ